MRAILQELVYDALSDGAVWPFDRRYIRPPHFHGQIELLLVTCGSATVHLGARAQRVEAGQLCWVLPGVPHVMSGFSSDFDMWVIELDAATVAACWRGRDGGDRDGSDAAAGGPQLFGWAVVLGDRLAGRATVDIGPDVCRRMGELAAQVWQAPSARGVRDDLRALGDLALGATLSAAGPGRGGPSVTDLASCLLLASPALDRPDLAAELGVSEGFLSRCFSRDLGVTFVEHRARARVAHFLGLVQNGQRNLLHAALGAGFGSYSQFHRVFTRVSDACPRDYLQGGRHRRQLLVAGDLDQPQAAPMRRLPDRQRHRARLDA